MRLAAAMSRINEVPITTSVIKKTFKIARDLFADFENAHYFKFSEQKKYELLGGKKIQRFRETVFDLLLSYKEISIEQVLQEAEKIGLNQKQTRSVFQQLINEGEIFESDFGKYRVTTRR